MEQLCKRLLAVYAVALDLAPDFFTEAFKEPQYALRMSHYPPAETGDDTIKHAPQAHIAHSRFKFFMVCSF